MVGAANLFNVFYHEAEVRGDWGRVSSGLLGGLLLLGNALKEMAMRFRKPMKLGVSGASPLSHDGCASRWTAATWR